MKTRVGLPSLASQRDALVADWATGAFTHAALAEKCQASEGSVRDQISRARAAGDPRALTEAQLRAAHAAREAALAARRKAPGLAETLGIRRGAVVVKRSAYATSAAARLRENRITLSAGSRAERAP
jgi:hypothetical protein